MSEMRVAGGLLSQGWVRFRGFAALVRCLLWGYHALLWFHLPEQGFFTSILKFPHLSTDR